MHFFFFCPVYSCLKKVLLSTQIFICGRVRVIRFPALITSCYHNLWPPWPALLQEHTLVPFNVPDVWEHSDPIIQPCSESALLDYLPTLTRAHLKRTQSQCGNSFPAKQFQPGDGNILDSLVSQPVVYGDLWSLHSEEIIDKEQEKKTLLINKTGHKIWICILSSQMVQPLVVVFL